ncbi:hypothetical protein GCM10027299_00700 [Larkinella ripae]
MRSFLLLGFLLSILVGCGDGSRRSENTADTTGTTGSASTDTVCFRQIVGNDTTTLRLVIDGSAVTGELAILPFEKDRARGPINGTVANNQIRADWQRSGEGVTQPYEMIFTLTGDAVTWMEGERVEKEGRWVLKEAQTGYKYKLLKTDCPSLSGAR